LVTVSGVPVLHAYVGFEPFAVERETARVQVGLAGECVAVCFHLPCDLQSRFLRRFTLGIAQTPDAVNVSRVAVELQRDVPAVEVEVGAVAVVFVKGGDCIQRASPGEGTPFGGDLAGGPVRAVEVEQVVPIVAQLDKTKPVPPCSHLGARPVGACAIK